MTMPGWIYNFSDYEQMYGLSEKDLTKKILEFPGVVGSFNAQASAMGANVLSAGPLFALSTDEMTAYANDFFERQVLALSKNPKRLKAFSQEKKKQVMMLWEESKALFLHDYPIGKAAGRYVPVNLDNLPFKTHEFDLALCSHLLFQKALPKGVSAIDLLQQLCDIALEVRLYPLLDDSGKITDELGPLMLALQARNYGVEVREVAYELQEGGNAMLRIWAQACVV